MGSIQELFSSIALLVSFLSAVLIAYLSPIKSYELSIYESTPIICWILFCLIYCISSLFFFFRFKISNYFKLFIVFILTLTHVSIINLPWIRGYFSWQGDQITQQYIVEKMITNGSINSYNPYPISHILNTILSIFTNINHFILSNVTSSIYSLLLILSTLLISKLIFKNNFSFFVIFYILSGIFFTQYLIYFMPNGLSMMYIPFIIYIYIKYMYQKQKKMLILFIPLIFLINEFHILSSLILSMYIVIFSIFNMYQIKLVKTKNIQKNQYDVIKIMVISILFLIINLFFINYYIYKYNINKFLIEIFSSEKDSILINNLNAIRQMNFTFIDTIFYVLKTEGPQLLLISFSLISLVFIIKNKIKLKKSISIPILFCILILGCIYALSKLGLLPGANTFAGNRFESYALLITPIFVATLFQYFQKKNKIQIIIYLFIIIACLTSIFSLFPSPIIYRPNIVLMRSEIISTNYLICMKQNDGGLSGIAALPTRIIEGRLNESQIVNLNLNKIIYLPDHFGYTKEISISHIVNESTYFYYTIMDSLIYNTIYRSVGRYTTDDFKNLFKDINANKCYTNNNVNILYIIKK